MGEGGQRGEESDRPQVCPSPPSQALAQRSASQCRLWCDAIPCCERGLWDEGKCWLYSHMHNEPLPWAEHDLAASSAGLRLVRSHPLLKSCESWTQMEVGGEGQQNV